MQQVLCAAAVLPLLCVHADRGVKFYVLHTTAVLPGVVPCCCHCDTHFALL